MNSVPLETLTLAKFKDLLNTRFRLRLNPTEEIEWELVQATPGRTTSQSGASATQYESFSLLFHGPESRFVPQGIRTFEHPQLGRFDLFIVPVGKEGGMIQYQAVFNRPLQS
jgi:hypothetical protein